MRSKWDKKLVAIIAEAITDDGDPVLDGHRYMAKSVLDALEAAGYSVQRIDGSRTLTEKDLRDCFERENGYPLPEHNDGSQGEGDEG